MKDGGERGTITEIKRDRKSQRSQWSQMWIEHADVLKQAVLIGPSDLEWPCAFRHVSSTNGGSFNFH